MDAVNLRSKLNLFSGVWKKQSKSYLGDHSYCVISILVSVCLQLSMGIYIYIYIHTKVPLKKSCLK